MAPVSAATAPAVAPRLQPATNPGKPARIDLRVELVSASQLRDTMDQIRSMADVLHIVRTASVDLGGIQPSIRCRIVLALRLRLALSLSLSPIRGSEAR